MHSLPPGVCWLIKACAHSSRHMILAPRLVAALVLTIALAALELGLLLYGITILHAVVTIVCEYSAMRRCFSLRPFSHPIPTSHFVPPSLPPCSSFSLYLHIASVFACN